MISVVELLQDLIRIPSVNPHGDPGTSHTGEGEIAAYIGDLLVKMNFDVHLQFAEKDRPNVIGRLKSNHSRQHLLLGPHLDTVSVSGMTIDPFSGKIENGKILGRGATDTKGPMASILAALGQLLESGWKPNETDIWFAGLMGEESGNDGIEFLMNSDFFPSRNINLHFGIAGEPTGLQIVHRHKGALWLRVRTRGRACHASIPSQGENAIMKMRTALNYVIDELPKLSEGLNDPLLGDSTFNPTVIRGGSKTNIIPDLCELEIDHRSLPQESHQQILKSLTQALPDCEVEIISDRPGLDTSPDHPAIQRLQRSVHTTTGMPMETILTGAPWFADCSLMSKAGIPSIAFGPGSINQAHTRDEFITISDLETGVRTFESFLRSLD